MWERPLKTSGDRHGWTRFETYLKVHHSYLDDLIAFGEVIQHSLTERDPKPEEYRIVRTLNCRDGLFVDVWKVLRINTAGQMRTVEHSYHAGVIGPQDRPIFRYDNAHAYTREGHPDPHHRHRFDPATWEEIEPPEWVGHDRWPHLDEVVHELTAWWGTTGRHLDLSPAPPG